MSANTNPEDKSYTFPLNEIIYLSPTVRSFLLESICLRLDMQGFTRYALHLLLEEDGKGKLIGHCPFCGSGGFLLNKSTGESQCPGCGCKEDLLALTARLSQHPSTIMNDALIYLSAYIQVEEERKSARGGRV